MESRLPTQKTLEFILETLAAMKHDGTIAPEVVLEKETPLIGDGAALDIQALVELLVGLEEFIEEAYDAPFDWTSDQAMSTRNSPLSTPNSLAEFAANGISP